MLAQRKRAFILTGTALLLAWALVLGGYWLARESKMTAEKVRAYAQSVDLRSLSGAERTRAIHKFANKLNSLSYEERQKARFDRLGMKWFEAMTDQEKAEFVDLTMPTGFKQMINSFEQMPENRRREAIDRAMRDLREARARMDAGETPPGAPRDNAPPISPEMQEQIKKIGLRTYFTEASAQTKAELAPLLEELQRMMESGRFFIGGRRGP